MQATTEKYGIPPLSPEAPYPSLNFDLAKFCREGNAFSLIVALVRNLLYNKENPSCEEVLMYGCGSDAQRDSGCRYCI